MPARVWFSLLAPPLAWFASLIGAYFMVGWACGSTTGRVSMHLTFLAMLAITAVAGLSAARIWRGSRDRSEPLSAGFRWPGDSADPAERERFLVTIATLGGVIFSLLIVTQWLAAMVIGPCEPSPRLPFSPSAFLFTGSELDAIV